MKRLAVIMGIAIMAAVTTSGTASAVSGPPSGAPCSVGKGATACFEAYGDVIWIKDNVKDGKGVTAGWSLASAPDDPRWCTNTLGSDAGWASCGMASEIPENDEISFRALVVGSDGTPENGSGTAGPLVFAATS
ncbi:hypothetical protein [Streptomyces luteolus]|uniref:Secreted protein n=1 Tax=Streptomyces luteolus TaxID=3043615 RepID=A0ABT6SW10_9ACTN|nr:hypothetical protein [Streptomyces sp. B-S-A12]MDI3419788.1 hypothetical protein [Streptomyces sp. B-S-A12]